MTQSTPTDTGKYLWANLKALPYFRSLLRAVEASYYEQIQLAKPIYDLGCGDGHFASIAPLPPIAVGLDPWAGPIREARAYPIYRSLVQADAAAAPFPDGHFASAVSNSVLEHIPHLDEVLVETARILRPGALFVFCSPNHQWLGGLHLPALLRKLGLKGLAGWYADLFRRISRHHHMLGPDEWRSRLDAAGFEIVDYWHYFRPASLHVLEWGHYFGLPSWVARMLLGRWILSPSRWNLGLTAAFLKPYATNERRTDGTYSFYVARRNG
ncbi:MAG: class I SAM-dependent methyltransferase [Anaerolineae bacterium]|nr:MAG: class I SAM-dependent methyltransferase [Anaerolineae bacterium]